jgi:hypothetical protein
MTNDTLSFDGDENLDHIRTDRCDLCQKHAPGVLFHSYGTPVLFSCKNCDAVNFEDAARRDINRWLAGGVF